MCTRDGPESHARASAAHLVLGLDRVMHLGRRPAPWSVIHNCGFGSSQLVFGYGLGLVSGSEYIFVG